MRRMLDGLYDASGALAAVSLLAILAIVLAQVALNFADWVLAQVNGRSFGLLIPSYATFAGYALAAATFLALAHTLRRGGHIRVTLFSRALPAGLRRVAETAVALLGAGVGALLTLNLGRHVHDAWRFGDMSSGLIPVPLWMPQSVLVAGAAILTVAFVDTAVEAWRGVASPAFAAEGDRDGGGEP